MIKNILLIGLGGGLGSMARYLCQKWFMDNHPHAYPWGTFAVNIVGCFLIGLLWGISFKSFAGNESWKLFNKYNLNFQTHLLSELREISYQQIPLLVEIRRDLGLIGDLTEIETHMKQQWDRMEAHYETLIATLVESAT